MWLGANVYLQLIVKHLLTQGDSMILAALSSLEDQGIYSLASNYGGLVARIVFQPIEESSRNLFARLLNTGASKRHDTDSVNAAKSHLVDILRAYGLFAALTFAIGPRLLPLVIHILIGSRWMSPKAENLLSAYCFYIPFLAFNGITEAFVSSAVNASDMRRQAAWMGVFSVCFAAVSFLLLQLGGLGALGLVWANIVNMSVRTIWSYLFIKKYLRQRENDLTLSEVSPERHTYAICLLALSIISAVRQSSEKNWHDTTKVVGIGTASAFLM
jgi:oligosaccharide translocation protein RFT1